MEISLRELRLLAQLPLAILANRLTWKTLTKQEKDEIIDSLWLATAMVENPLLLKGLQCTYDWCLRNYE